MSCDLPDGDQIHVAFSGTACDLPDGDEIHVSFVSGGEGETAPVAPPVSLAFDPQAPDWTFTPVITNPPQAVSRLLYAWGNNVNSSTGTGLEGVVSRPTLINSIANALPGESVTAWNQSNGRGNQYSIGLVNGRLYGWGRNSEGQLPNPDAADPQPTPIRLAGTTGLVFDKVVPGATTAIGWFMHAIADGKLYARGNGPVLAFEQVGSFDDWTDVASGGGHVIGIRSGQLYSWGSNFNGATGHGTTGGTTTVPTRLLSSFDDFVWVAARGERSFAIRAGGELYAWGRNTSGSLGLGTSTTNILTPQQVAGEGWNRVSAGTGHTLALRNDGELWGWGSATQGALLGLSGANRLSPVLLDDDLVWTAIEASSARSFAIESGRLWAWGDNTDGSLGDGNEGALQTVWQRIMISDHTDWVHVEQGFAIREASVIPPARLGIEVLQTSMYTARRPPATELSIQAEAPRQLFQVAPPPVTLNVEALRPVLESHPVGPVAIGVEPRELSRRVRALYAWGSNQNARTGLGEVMGTTESPTRIDSDLPIFGGWDRLSIASRHVLAILDGKLYAWGVNSTGQLGDGTISSRTTPVRIGSYADWSDVAAHSDRSFGIRGGHLYQWGAGAGLSPQQVGLETGWTRIAISGAHQLGVRDGMLFAWGSNGSGQLGTGDTDPRSEPTLILAFPGLFFDNWFDVAAGNNASGALRGDGLVYTWGSVSTGLVGNGTTDATMRTSPGLADSFSGWQQLSFGRCALAIKNGELYSWGTNQDGVTGQGETEGFTLEPTQVGSLTGWSGISQRQAVSLATRNGLLYVWGSNAYSTTQQGTTEGSTTEPSLVDGVGWALPASGSAPSVHSMALATQQAEYTFMPDPVPSVPMSIIPLSVDEGGGPRLAGDHALTLDGEGYLSFRVNGAHALTLHGHGYLNGPPINAGHTLVLSGHGWVTQTLQGEHTTTLDGTGLLSFPFLAERHTIVVDGLGFFVLPDLRKDHALTLHGDGYFVLPSLSDQHVVTLDGIGVFDTPLFASSHTVVLDGVGELSMPPMAGAHTLVLFGQGVFGLPEGASPYKVLVTNAETTAMSEYTLGYDSAVVVGGDLFLVGETLDKLSGDPVRMDVTTGFMSFESDVIKRIDSIMAMAEHEDLVIMIRAVVNGEVIEHWYRPTRTGSGSIREWVVKVGKGIKSQHYAIRLSSSGPVHRLDVYVIKSSRRRYT